MFIFTIFGVRKKDAEQHLVENEKKPGNQDFRREKCH